MKQNLKYLLMFTAFAGIIGFTGCTSEDTGNDVQIEEKIEFKDEAVEDNSKGRGIISESQWYIGIVAKDIQDVLPNSPIDGREDEIMELLVFKNPVYALNNPGSLEELPEEEQKADQARLLEKVEYIVGALDLGEIQRYEYTPSVYRSPSRLSVSGADYNIIFENSGEYYLALNDDYFSKALGETVDELAELHKAALQQYFKAVSGFGHYEKFITKSYDIYGGVTHGIHIYPSDESKTLEEQLLMAEFNSFWLSDGYYTGNYNEVRGFRGYLEALGEEPEGVYYPIITKEEALRQLLAGNYYSASYPSDDALLEDAQIEGIVLSYLHAYYNEYYVPVYEVYATFENSVKGYFKDESLEEEFDKYVCFYVPAVLPEYVEELKYEFHFN